MDFHVHEEVLTARINCCRVLSVRVRINVMQQCINMLWNIPLSNDSSPSSMEKEHEMKCCSSSCKINLDGRWTRMSVFDIPTCKEVGAAGDARAHELGCPENVHSYSSFWTVPSLGASIHYFIPDQIEDLCGYNLCSPQLKPHIRGIIMQQEISNIFIFTKIIRHYCPCPLYIYSVNST